MNRIAPLILNNITILFGDALVLLLHFNRHNLSSYSNATNQLHLPGLGYKQLGFIFKMSLAFFLTKKKQKLTVF